MDLTLLKQKDEFADFLIQKLGDIPIDFHEKLQHIDSLRKANERHLAAGILLILIFKNRADSCHGEEGEYFFKLIKRSDKVPQPGDLSCPGGMLNRFLDPILGLCISSGLLPIMNGKALAYVKDRGAESFKAINLFLANAVRESWEEIRINPFSISFTGALPSYTFSPAKRTIFPVAGVVKNSSSLRPNEEVEKVVDIPISAFFDESNYANFVIDPPLPDRSPHDFLPQYPCLVYRDIDGEEEVLWGATYNIILDFLYLTLGHRQPDMSGRRIIKRSLRPDYMRYVNK